MNRREAILVYDGECGLCSRSLAWVSTRWAEDRRPRVVASQTLDDGQLIALSISRRDVERAVWWIEGERRFQGNMAVAKSLAACRGPWGVVGRSLERRPLRWMTGPAYRAVARNRNLFSRGPSACRVPR